AAACHAGRLGDRRAARVRNDRLHQLSRDSRHSGRRAVRSRSYAFDEPRHPRVGGGSEHTREPATVAEGSGGDQARLADAGHADHRRRARRARALHAVASLVGVSGRSDVTTEVLTVPSVRIETPTWGETLHAWVTTVDHKRIGLLYILFALLFLA